MHLPSKQRVVGSSPARSTNFKLKITYFQPLLGTDVDRALKCGVVSCFVWFAVGSDDAAAGAAKKGKSQ